MLTVSECVAKAALLREESRGGHTRDDFPGMNAEWRKLLLVCSLESAGDGVTVVKKDQIPMRADLLELFERDELKKYLTEEELPA
jgi:succinate dehydrogenase / fumarate reductase flavoprotein subunit